MFGKVARETLFYFRHRLVGKLSFQSALNNAPDPLICGELASIRGFLSFCRCLGRSDVSEPYTSASESAAMSSGQELGLPDQHKVRAREIRRKLHFSWSERYEKEHRLEERARKAIEEAIRVRLEADLPACELLLALFASAAASTRRTTVCSPFPRSLVGPDGPLFEESVRFPFGDLTYKLELAVPSTTRFQTHFPATLTSWASN